MKIVKGPLLSSYVFFILFLGVFFFGTVSAGTVVNVTTGVSYGTDLQTAINETRDGDVLKLKGTFTGNFTVPENKSNITLRGFKKKKTIQYATLDGNQAGSVLTILGRSVNLKFLIIQNGVALFGGGIANYGSKTSINQCQIENNLAVDVNGILIARGGGVYTIGDMILNQTTIRRNTVEGIGGGVFINQAKVSVNNSKIRRNTATFNPSRSADGGGLYIFDSTVHFVNSSITANSAGSQGGGIFDDRSTLFLEDTQVKNNTPDNIFHRRNL